MQKSQPKIAILIIAIAMILGGWLSHVITTTHQALPALQTGSMIFPPRPIEKFSLLDSHGQAVTQSTLANRWSVLFFGYTTCPEVCPTTLAVLAATHKLLADLPLEAQPKFIFVSVDPQRDSAENLLNYLNYFNPDFFGYTGTQQQLDSFTKSMGVPVLIQPAPNGAYTIDHSASLFVINPQLQLQAIFSPPYQATTLATDLRQLVTYKN